MRPAFSRATRARAARSLTGVSAACDNRFEVSDEEDGEPEVEEARAAAEQAEATQADAQPELELGGGSGLDDDGLAPVDEDGEAGFAPDSGGAIGGGEVDFADGGEVDFASRYSRDAIDVPATLDSMTEGIMQSFRARREQLTEASRQRQQELREEVAEAEAAVLAAPEAAPADRDLNTID